MSSLYVISAVGKDKPGLVHSLTNVLAGLNINIVDADARSVRGHFSMFVVVDLSTSKCSYEDMVQALDHVSASFDLGLRTDKYVAGRRKSNKKLMVLTIMGRDRPGIVATFSGILAENSINIEQIKMIARGDYIAMDLTIDTSDFPDTKSLRKVLYKHTEMLGLDISLRNNNIFSRPKRVIVFDCDSTIIKQEVIDELAKTAGVDHVVKEITDKAMNGGMDFQESLRERVKLLKGLPAEKLELLINTIKLTPGAEELISSLRFMGYKIAVISGGFSFFTDHLKKTLNLDYVFANELEIKNGIVTGKLKGEIIDAEKKGELLIQIADNEGFPVDQIVAVGDGSNDRFMLSNAGLAIGFNPKEILKDYSDGMITSDNISGLLYFLGVPDTE